MLEIEELIRRKSPGGLYDKILIVDTSLLTGARNYKKARRATELLKYYDTIVQDLNEADGGGLLYRDPLTWWQTVGQRTYPILYKVALDFLLIPATSCECERAFSGGRRTITFERNLLSRLMIEAL